MASLPSNNRPKLVSRRKQPDSGTTGMLLVDKPAGMTSHDVIDVVRKALGTRKVGHAGTLDPDATGLLVIGVGFGTKLLEYSVGCDKTYEAQIQFGTTTSTLDAAGEVTGTFDMALDPAEVTEAVKKLTGDIMQVPPMVSAVKVDGKRLHELAREGKTVERKERAVTVSQFDIWLSGEESTFERGLTLGSVPSSPAELSKDLRYDATITCSSGTYVRTLAADLGELLGGGAHLSGLRRTVVGKFNVDSGVALEDITADALMPLTGLLGDMPQLGISPEQAVKVGYGQALDLTLGEGKVAIMSPESELLAVYSSDGSSLRPEKVLPT